MKKPFPKRRRGRRALVLSSGPPISLKVLYCLNAAGVTTDLLDLGPVSIARYSRFCKRYRRLTPPIREDDTQRLAEVIERHRIQWGTEIVIASDILSAGMLHAIQHQLVGLAVFPVSPSALLEKLDNKWTFYNFLTANRIPAPPATLLETAEDFDRAVPHNLTFPLFLKPLHTESGHGLRWVADPDELSRHVATEGRHTALPLMLQEYAPGYDADVSLLAWEGEILAHVIQSRKDPAALEFIEHDAILDAARRIVAASGYSGVANIDVRVDETSGSVQVLECNPRFWYTLQASAWRGLNFLDIGIGWLMGECPVPRAVSGGKYHLHGGLLRKTVWNPVRWKSIPRYNWQGLLQSLSDPTPFVAARRARQVDFEAFETGGDTMILDKDIERPLRGLASSHDDQDANTTLANDHQKELDRLRRENERLRKERELLARVLTRFTRQADRVLTHELSTSE